MSKYIHEIRDPIHVFIKLNSYEREILDSRPMQRLRYIHQLALSYLVYPGATHRRFEHSLGVMELASRVYDIITDFDNIRLDSIRELVRGNADEGSRKTLRIAALCHDLGHLPFSHAAEKDLLPEGWNHERITIELIFSDEIKSILSKINVQAEDVAKIAVGPDKYSKYDESCEFTIWESVLSEIITSDAFGVDRIDYLLRDSLHTGVAYGKFDHYRLIDCLRLLPKSEKDSTEPTLGIEEGGLHSAEALILARYFMYAQLYCHPIRRIYDIHLRDFLQKNLINRYFPIDIDEYLKISDNDIITEMIKAARDESHPGYKPAKYIIEREHFKLLYQRNPGDTKTNPGAGEAIFKATCLEFEDSNVRYDTWREESSKLDFPVIDNDDNIISSLEFSKILEDIPLVAIDFVFINRECQIEAKKWLNENRQSIIAPKKEKSS
ncbi:MAG: HD domain-containing protein [candidate division Zixibacteria bacterium]|nr:HD domain-containing protein [Candidatus Tariuqbacter arcticus]